MLNIYDCIVNDGLARIVKDGLARVMRKPHMMQPHRGVMEAGKEVGNEPGHLSNTATRNG